MLNDPTCLSDFQLARPMTESANNSHQIMEEQICLVSFSMAHMLCVCVCQWLGKEFGL